VRVLVALSLLSSRVFIPSFVALNGEVVIRVAEINGGSGLYL